MSAMSLFIRWCKGLRALEPAERPDFPRPPDPARHSVECFLNRARESS
eukprot:COSAG04_NODE_6076_length_1416_cov_45.870919_1_plen_47_part_10